MPWLLEPSTLWYAIHTSNIHTYNTYHTIHADHDDDLDEHDEVDCDEER